jgi:hypothetical protein
MKLEKCFVYEAQFPEFRWRDAIGMSRQNCAGL